MRIIDIEAIARKAFDELTVEQKQQAIFDLIDQGLSDRDVASITRTSVEAVRQIVGKRNETRS